MPFPVSVNGISALPRHWLSSFTIWYLIRLRECVSVYSLATVGIQRKVSGLQFDGTLRCKYHYNMPLLLDQMHCWAFTCESPYMEGISYGTCRTFHHRHPFVSQYFGTQQGERDRSNSTLTQPQKAMGDTAPRHHPRKLLQHYQIYGIIVLPNDLMIMCSCRIFIMMVVRSNTQKL